MGQGQSSFDEQRLRLRQQWLEEARQADRGDRPYAGKRGEHRYAWNAPLEVRVPSANAGTETYFATAVNISGIGVGFHCRQKIEQFTEVEIVVSGETVGVPAVVKQVTTTVNGFVIGAEFVSG